MASLASFAAGPARLSSLKPGQRTTAAIYTTALIVGIAVIVAALVSFTQRASERSTAAAALELHSVQVMLETQRLLSTLQDVETGERGFLLTGNETFLEPYNRGRAEALGRYTALQNLTVDSPLQQRNLGALKRMMDTKIAYADARVAQLRRGDRTGAIEETGQNRGKQVMDEMRSIIESILGEEDRLLVERRAASDSAAATAKRAAELIIGFGVLVLLGAMVAAAAAVNAARAARALQRANLINERVREQLEARVVERTVALEAAHDQVRQMQKMEAIGQLTGGIAHDFNNMLSVVIGSLDLAVRRLDRGRDDIRPLIANATEGANRAAQLTARLLAFSRQQTLIPTVIDANALVAAMSELLRRTIGEHVRLETVLAGGLWRSKVDASQVENAVLNLAVNARDAMESGGRLTIETANVALDDAYAALHADINSGQYVMIAVTDTGSGMPPEVVARAFDPFFTTKPVGKGTGLGLSQVFGFVKQSQGHVNVYSEPGRGTTIKLYLPRYFGEDETAAAAATVETMPRARSGETVLVVEDEAQVREMTVTALRDLGYVVRHAPNGAEALRLLSESLPVTLLFTDIVMPGMTGRELADHALAARPGLRVLYTTGYTRNAVVHDGTLDPRTAFLAKPFNMADLANKVRQTIDGDSNAGVRRSV